MEKFHNYSKELTIFYVALFVYCIAAQTTTTTLVLRTLQKKGFVSFIFT